MPTRSCELPSGLPGLRLAQQEVAFFMEYLAKKAKKGNIIVHAYQKAGNVPVSPLVLWVSMGTVCLSSGDPSARLPPSIKKLPCLKFTGEQLVDEQSDHLMVGPNVLVAFKRFS
uniref:SFRICE_004705 n=1 Tax=Spodoptera frugiperda TaxID=7108 RepID=A0A2H1VC24_SPOFR